MIRNIIIELQMGIGDFSSFGFSGLELRWQNQMCLNVRLAFQHVAQSHSKILASSAELSLIGSVNSGNV